MGRHLFSSLLRWFQCLLLLPVALGEERPNVLLIITDDQGWGDIGYNNPEKVFTPNLDRLAGESALFSNHYVMPQCTPTRVAVFTGRYPGRFGRAPLQATTKRCFPVGTPTLATMMKDAGYRTFLCGKWHMGTRFEDGPNHHGFDYSYGCMAGATGMYDHRYREGEFFESWHRNHKLIPGHENGVHATDLTARDAVRIIKGKHSQPFFMMLTFQAPHTPLDERGRFVDQPTRLDPDHPDRWMNEDEIEWFNDPKGLIQSEPDPEKRLFLATVHHLDHAIGEVIAALDKSGQRDNTLILFSSDNGPQGSWSGDAYPDDLKLTNFNQPIPMRGLKTDVWEGGIRVPGFIHWPGRIKPRTIEDQVHIIDWFPTLATIAGGKSMEPGALDGVDLTPLLFDGESLEKRDFYWIWREEINRRALRFGDWKIVRYGKGEPAGASDWKLFNLREDPMEASNLAGSRPEVAAMLHERYKGQRAKDRE